MKRAIDGHSPAFVWLVLVVLAGIMACAGCGSSDAQATKEEEARFRDRDPSHIHGPPAGFVPGGGRAPGAAPAGAAGPPGGASAGAAKSGN